MMHPLREPSAFSHLADTLASDWSLIARPEQLEPVGDHTHWMILTGRGWGKTRTGAEWVRAQARDPKARIALVGATAADCRDVMIEGESGIMACSPKNDYPNYEPSKRRITWRNGALATAYSSDEPDRLRGPQHSHAWIDEAGAFRYPEIWQQLMLGLRLGRRPRTIITTTPRPVKIIRDLVAREGLDVAITRGRTMENAANLAPTFLETITKQFAGTRIGRQELDGELLEDMPGALWQRSWIDRDRKEQAPELKRIVVAIDPAVTSGEDADETGIVVAGVGRDDHGYVLADLSGKFAPHEWAQRAVAAYHLHKADRIVAEVNNGGEMVESVIRQIDRAVSFRAVHASRGKVVRAEPVSALYEQGRVHHVGSFDALEDQQCSFSSNFERSKAGYSPDRVDAAVWAITDLMVGAAPVARGLASFGVWGRGADISSRSAMINAMSPEAAIAAGFTTRAREIREGRIKA